MIPDCNVWSADVTSTAVLTRLMHPFVWTGEVREGSYVRLDKYTLEFGKKLNGQGTTA